jgi:uncharacterized damage-inducible protein DinB
MNYLAHFADQLAYTLWANNRTIASIEALSESSSEPPARTLKLMSHVVAALTIWYARVVGDPAKALPVWGAMTLAEIKTHNATICSAWIELLASKTESDLQTSYSYRNTQGNEYTNTLLEMLTHFPIHSAYHRAQIAQIVREQGGTPAVTDYIQFAREEHKR